MAETGRHSGETGNEIEVTSEMVEAAEKALWDHATRFNIVTLDEMHHDTMRLVIAAALSRYRGTAAV